MDAKHSATGQYFKRQVLPVLADLRLAIVLLLAIALFSIAGTVIEQGQTLAFYQENYPEDPALFGFFILESPIVSWIRPCLSDLVVFEFVGVVWG